MKRSRVINGIGLTMTGTVLVIVLLSKFTQGAYIAIIAMAVLFVLMKSIRRHYDRVSAETALVEGEEQMLPSRVRAVVLVSKLHKPTARALAFAKASRPSVLEALTVAVDPEETDRLVEQWHETAIDIPLKVVASPYREVTNPILDYVRNLRKDSPRDVVTVYIPEYVVGHWWEQILHNQSALRLKARLLFTPGVMVTSVPYLLESSGKAEERLARDDRRVPAASDLPGLVMATLDVSGGGRGRTGRSRRPLRGPARRAGGLRPARAAGGAGADPRHRHQPRQVLAGGRVRGPRAGRGSGRAAVSRGRSGALRWLRLPARQPRRRSAGSRPPCWPSSWSGWPGSSGPARWRRSSPPAAEDGLHWRTRMRYQVDGDGVPGLRRHRSHQIEPLPTGGCRIAHVERPTVHDRSWTPDSELVAVAGPVPTLLVDGKVGRGQCRDQRARRRARPGGWPPTASGRSIPRPPRHAGRRGAQRPTAASRASGPFDLYCGVGLFAGALVDAGVRAWGVEWSREAIVYARRNVPEARFTAGKVERVAPNVAQAHRPGRPGSAAHRCRQGRGRRRDRPAAPGHRVRGLRPGGAGP